VETPDAGPHTPLAALGEADDVHDAIRLDEIAELGADPLRHERRSLRDRRDQSYRVVRVGRQGFDPLEHRPDVAMGGVDNLDLAFESRASGEIAKWHLCKCLQVVPTFSPDVSGCAPWAGMHGTKTVRSETRCQTLRKPDGRFE
jgi:hypothetical protein